MQDVVHEEYDAGVRNKAPAVLMIIAQYPFACFHRVRAPDKMLEHAYLITTIYGLQPSFPQRLFEDCLIWMKSVRSVRPEREREKDERIYTPYQTM